MVLLFFLTRVGNSVIFILFSETCSPYKLARLASPVISFLAALRIIFMAENMPRSTDMPMSEVNKDKKILGQVMGNVSFLAKRESKIFKNE